MPDEPSYIVRKRDLADIIQNPDKNAIEEFLEDPAAVLAASLTELFSSPIVYMGRGVRLVQAAFKGEVFQQLGREVTGLRGKGKLPSDLKGNKQGYQTWVELLTIIDEDTPDAERLEALKAMFLASNRLNATDAEQVLGYQLFQIAKRLNSNDLLVLKAVYELHSKGWSNAYDNGYARWADDVAKHMGHHLRSLIELAENALAGNKLLSARGPSGDSVNLQNARLTNLGLKFCENIQRYQMEKKELKIE